MAAIRSTQTENETIRPDTVATSIYKYQLPISDRPTKHMQKGSQVLHAAMQNGVLSVWARVDPSAEQTLRRFSIFGTGHVIPDEHIGKFVSTVLDREFVWHVFVDPEAQS